MTAIGLPRASVLLNMIRTPVPLNGSRPTLLGENAWVRMTVPGVLGTLAGGV